MARSSKARKAAVAGVSRPAEVRGRSSRNRPVSPEVRAEILRLVASGRKAVDVGKEFAVNPCTISGWRREAREREPAVARRKRRRSAEVVEAPAPPVTGPVPAETGRYVSSFKQEVLRQVFAGRKIVAVGEQYGVPARTIHRWLGEWARADAETDDPAPGAKLEGPRPGGATPIQAEHRALVLSIKHQHPNMGLAQIQNQLKRFHALKLSRHMIGRIFREAGIPLQVRSPASTQEDRSKNRFEMTRPNELWAIDFKEIWIHAERIHALFVLDDYSRFCVGFALSKSPSADLAISTIAAAIQRHGRPERILSDRGGQFHSWNGVSRFDEFLADFLVDHTVTKADHPFTNGKLEAFNNSLETEVLDVEEIASIEDAVDKVRAHVARYNFLRTHMGIGGLVPADRYFGMVEEAQAALERGLSAAGPGLKWLRGLVNAEGPAARRPCLLQLVLSDGKLELLALGRRFTVGQ